MLRVHLCVDDFDVVWLLDVWSDLVGSLTFSQCFDGVLTVYARNHHTSFAACEDQLPLASVPNGRSFRP